MKINNLYVTKDKRNELRNNVLMPEKILWKWIRNKQLDHKFRRQHGISRYIVDFYCPELKLIIEVDGRIHDKILERDKIREKYFKSIGLIIKRYTAKEVGENLEWVLSDLKNCCKMIRQVKDGKPPLTPP